jgi:hypothetical protein
MPDLSRVQPSKRWRRPLLGKNFKYWRLLFVSFCTKLQIDQINQSHDDSTVNTKKNWNLILFSEFNYYFFKLFFPHALFVLSPLSLDISFYVVSDKIIYIYITIFVYLKISSRSTTVYQSSLFNGQNY